jgi:putative DNA primase/helicase
MTVAANTTIDALPVRTDVPAAASFLAALFGHAAPGWLTIHFPHPTRRQDDGRPLLCTDWYRGADTAGAAKRAVDLGVSHCTWFGVGLRGERQDGGKRGGVADVIAIPGLWADIDIKHKIHKKSESLPPTLQAARDIIRPIGMAPSFVIDTGHGLQPWWLFDELWVFASEDERQAAQKLANAWKATIQHFAREAGAYTVDAVADVARVMRPPGTLNHKDPADVRPVRVVEAAEYLRYPSAFDEWLVKPEPEPKGGRGAEWRDDLTPEPAAEPEGEDKYDLSDDDLLRKALGASNGMEFGRLLRGDTSGNNNDASAADLALCNHLVFWTNGDRGRMDRLFRRSGLIRPKWDEKHYSNGETYGAHTIGMALKGWTGKGYEPRAAGNGRHEGDGDGKQQPCPDLSDVRGPAKAVAGGILDKRDPLPTARKFVAEHYDHPDGRTLVNSGGVFYGWNGTAYAGVEDLKLRKELYDWFEQHRRKVKGKDGKEWDEPFKPTKADVDNTIDPLRSAVAYTPARDPAWLVEGRNLPDPATLVVARNGIADINRPGAALLPPTPRLFTCNALSYDYGLAAPKPIQWTDFLDLILPDDPESVALLQEWFGYCLTADTRQQKILMLIGPRRSGKGTIGRVLANMLGLNNVCGPTLAGLGTNFGLWPLIGKRLALISDARLSGRSDLATVTERLLSISGEDAITVDRKNLVPLTLKMLTRIMIMTNELPRLTDASGALASRFLIVVLKRSFYDREDTTLTDRLLTELPGILNWSVAGWQRLRERGRFVQPAAAEQMIDDLNDLASPIGAFVRDWCNVRSGECVTCADLYDAWCCWCHEQGRESPGDRARFGRDLRAAFGVGGSQPRTEDGSRPRQYEGIDLTLSAKESVSRWRAAKDRAARDGTRSTP